MKWYFDFLGSQTYWEVWIFITILSGVAAVVFAAMALLEANTYSIDDDDARMFARCCLGALVLGPLLGVAWGVILPVAGVVAILWGGFTVLKIAGLGSLFSKSEV